MRYAAGDRHRGGILSGGLPSCSVSLPTTHDVRALARVAVAARLVPAAVDHPADGGDAEVGVACRAIAGELRCAAPDVEAVVFRASGDVAPEPGVPGRVVDVHPVLPGPADVVAAHHGAHHHATWWAAHDDRVPLDVADRRAGDHVAVDAVDLDRAAHPPAAPNVEDAVSGDHVAVTGGDVDPDLAVSNAAVAPHPIAVGPLQDDSEKPVVCEPVPLDQVVG